MDTMKGFDAFERSLKGTMEPYEVPYNSADWAQLEQRIGADGSPSGRSVSLGLYALLASGTIAAVTTLIMLAQPKESAITVLADSAEDHHAMALQPQDSAPALASPSLSMDAAPMAAGQEVAIGQVGPDAVASRTSSSLQNREEIPPVVPPTVEASKEMLIKPSRTEGCPGTEVVFALSNMPDQGIHLWNFGDGSFSNKPSPTHIFTKSGTFEVMLSHSSVGGGSFNNKPASDLIVIHDAPAAKFTPLKREFDNTIPSWHFENRSMGGQDYLWDFGDGTTSTTPYPDHVFKKKGNYTVSLTVTNGKGCVDRTERAVRVDSDYNLLAADMFSPDGDGFEDTFIPEALRTLGVRFHLSIFDGRSGQLIYQTTDAARPWNGRISNKGEFCQPGEYLWMVEMKDGEKLGGTYNGSVNLVR